MKKYLAIAVSYLVQPPQVDDEQGLSQSTENAVLLTGALVIATTVITLVGKYVTAHLPK